MSRYVFLIAAGLLFANLVNADERLRNRDFFQCDEQKRPVDWKVTVTPSVPSSKIPLPAEVTFREQSVIINLRDGMQEVTVHQPKLDLPGGDYRLSFTAEGTGKVMFRAVVMYQSKAQVWQHSDAQWYSVPNQPIRQFITFSVPQGVTNAYIFLSAKGCGSVTLSKLSLAGLMPQETPRLDPEKYWPRTELFAVPPYSDAVNCPESQVEGLRSIIFDSTPVKGQPSKIFAYIGYPALPPPPQGYPAVVLVHGGGGTALAQYVKDWNRRGYAAIAMDHYGTRPVSGKAQSTMPLAGGYKNAEEWQVRAVAAIVRAHSLLRAQPNINTSKIALIGVSWGGVFASIVAAIDDRLKGIVAIYGCGYWSEGDQNLQFYRWRNEFWDPKHFLHAAKVPIFWVDGTNDAHFGVIPLQASIDAAAVTANRTLTIALPHGHQGFLFPAVTRYVDQILCDGMPLPKLGKIQFDRNVATASIQDAGKGLKYVGLVYTSDANPAFSQRTWRMIPAQISLGKVFATVPKDATQFYLTAYDEFPTDGLIPSVASNVVTLQ